MADGADRTPLRDTAEFRALQDDERFVAWQRMQEAAIPLQFIVFDVPELRDHLYTREGLEIAERTALERYPDFNAMFSPENYTVAMRFVYYVGETLRRAIEGRWVALPATAGRSAVRSVIDADFQTGFYDPMQMLKFAFRRRSRPEVRWIFDNAVEDHRKWIDAGRPLRRFD